MPCFKILGYPCSNTGASAESKPASIEGIPISLLFCEEEDDIISDIEKEFDAKIQVTRFFEIVDPSWKIKNPFVFTTP